MFSGGFKHPIPINPPLPVLTTERLLLLNGKTTKMKTILTSWLWAIGILTASAQTTLDSATNFQVKDIHGKVHKLFDYLDDGKYVLIDFFYTGCNPCIGSIPALAEVFEKFGCNSQDLIQLSINAGENELDLLEYLNDYQPVQPLISGTEGGGNQVLLDYGIEAFPTVILIAPSREILNPDIFPVTTNNLDFALGYQAGLDPVTDGCQGVLSQVARPVSNNLIAISPNPSIGDLQVIVESPKNQKATLEIFDMLLHSLYTEELLVPAGTFQKNLDLQWLPSGHYWLTWQSEELEPYFSQIQIFR